jgi:cytidylate kinase
MKHFTVTIDGPAGSGKTTIARDLGLRLGWFVLESGTLYRVVAYLLHRADPPDMQNRESMLAAAREAAQRVTFARAADGTSAVAVDSRLMGNELRTQEIGEMASILAADSEVRDILLPLQRSVIKRERYLIAEGRDMGTRVFPDADVKFFLTASLEVRAMRRQKELAGLGIARDVDEVMRQIRERDERDERREASPLKPAASAVVVDTSRMGIRDVVSELFEIISPRVREMQESELYETRFKD